MKGAKVESQMGKKVVEIKWKEMVEWNQCSGIADDNVDGNDNDTIGILYYV